MSGTGAPLSLDPLRTTNASIRKRLWAGRAGA